MLDGWKPPVRRGRGRRSALRRRGRGTGPSRLPGGLQDQNAESAPRARKRRSRGQGPPIEECRETTGTITPCIPKPLRAKDNRGDKHKNEGTELSGPHRTYRGKTHDGTGDEHVERAEIHVESVHRIPRPFGGRVGIGVADHAFSGSQDPQWEHRREHSLHLQQETVANPSTTKTTNRRDASKRIPSGPKKRRSTKTRKTSTTSNMGRNTTSNEFSNRGGIHGALPVLEDVLADRRDFLPAEGGRARDPTLLGSDIPISQRGPLQIGDRYTDGRTRSRESGKIQDTSRFLGTGECSDASNNRASKCGAEESKCGSVRTLGEEGGTHGTTSGRNPSGDNQDTGETSGPGNIIYIPPPSGSGNAPGSARSHRKTVSDARTRRLIRPAFPLKLVEKKSGEPNLLPEPILLGRSAEPGVVLPTTTEDPQLRKMVRPDERIHKNVGKLDKTSTCLIDLDAVKSLEPDNSHLSTLISVITNVVEFRKRLCEARLKQGRIGRHMLHHLQDLLNQDLIRVLNEEEKFEVGMPLFTVLKKNLNLRLIQNCIPLNKAFDRPPPMELPRIHDVIEQILDAKYVAQADAVSFFYQIPIHPDVQPYFGTRIAGGRGTLIRAVLKRLPMGWSWAPCIAQAISNALIRKLGTAWVDNYIVCGTDLTEFMRNREIFIQRVRKIGLELDNELLTPSTSLSCLGMEFDCLQKKYRMSVSWNEKTAIRIETLFSSPTVTCRDLYCITGCLIWRSHVLRLPLCHYPSLMALVGKIGSQIMRQQLEWDSSITISPTIVSELNSFLCDVRTSDWTVWKKVTSPPISLWSDSSDSCSAFLLFANDTLIHCHQQEEDPQEHIFLKELRIALLGISTAHELGHSGVHLYTDNAASAMVLQRRLSTNYAANTLMDTMLPSDLDLQVTWVPTHQQLADPYTRGHPLPPVGSSLVDCRDFLEGPKPSRALRD